MEGTEVLRRLIWQVCDVVDAVWETPTVRSLFLDCPGWAGHLPGQHVDVRLTAEDGYQAERSYSIATPRRDGRVALTIQRLNTGEVSPYLCDLLPVGGQLELRGPIGGYFIWEPAESSVASDSRVDDQQPDAAPPVLLVGGGTGVVPLMAMLRRRVELASGPAVRLLLSARSYEEIIYRSELERIAREQPGLGVFQTLTRSQPEGWAGYVRRIDRDMLNEVAWPAGAQWVGQGLPAQRPAAWEQTAAKSSAAGPAGQPARSQGPIAYVCGPTSFVETVADLLIGLGYAPEQIRTERFGPTGGPP
jgi:ferredoxin-NADP reductase